MIVCISVCLFLVIVLFQIISSAHAPSLSFRRTCVFPLLSVAPSTRYMRRLRIKSDVEFFGKIRVPRSAYTSFPFGLCIDRSPLFVCCWKHIPCFEEKNFLSERVLFGTWCGKTNTWGLKHLFSKSNYI